MENKLDLIVCKFGGSSVSNEGQFKKVKKIIESNELRRIVITSAIGKSKESDNKITDLLYLLYAHVKYNVNYSSIFNVIKERYLAIRNDLGLSVDLEKEFDIIEKNIKDYSEDYLVSRGEYLSALLLSNYLGYEFLDSKDIIKFDYNGKVDYKLTQSAFDKHYKFGMKVVIPGFYGSYPNGDIKLFSRGGSDITGSIISRVSNAIRYENYTDVNGFYMASPKIINNPLMIKEITYNELRELSYMGASVIHEEAIFPIQESNIPLYILNTNSPESGGTIITNSNNNKSNIITGIAGKKDFLVINIIKNKNSSKLDVISFVLDVLKKYNVPIESIPTSIDSMSIVCLEKDISKYIYDIISILKDNNDIEDVSVVHNIALIAIVGKNMVYKPGISAKIFSVFGNNNINIKLISQNINELSIIVGIENKDFEKAISCVYNEIACK